jgi:hypothetical protein
MDQQDKSTDDSPGSVHPVQLQPGVVAVQRPDGRWTADPDALAASGCCGGACHTPSIGSAAR